MYSISNHIYRDLGDSLIAAIGAKEFFSGSVCVVDGDVECRLICTLIIERRREPNGEERCGAITSIRAVWWECRTTIAQEELYNDFSFSELLETIF